MPRFLKIALLVLGGLILLCSIVLVILAYRLDLRIDEAYLRKNFQDYEGAIPEYIKDDPYSYLDNGLKSDYTIVFVHGAPGSARDFANFMRLPELKPYHMICYERRGYGSFNYGSVDTDILSQGKELMEFLDRLEDSKKIILVGHSYGAPVVMAAASLDQDKRVEGVLLVSGLMSSKLEELFWFNPLLNTSIIRSILPSYARMSNDEKMTHAKALTEAESHWKDVNCPVYTLHGDKDWIAPVENAYFMDSILSIHHHLEILSEGDHLLQMNGKNEIFTGIEWLINYAENLHTQNRP